MVSVIDKEKSSFRNIVESFKHLGHVISSDFDDAGDIQDKLAVFIGQANNMFDVILVSLLQTSSKFFLITIALAYSVLHSGGWIMK
jgi:hypothetical protein